MKKKLWFEWIIIVLMIGAPFGLALQVSWQPRWFLVAATALLGAILGVRMVVLVLDAQLQAHPEAADHEFSLIGHKEEETLRLADAWMIMAELFDECDGEFHMIDQDRVVHALNALDAAVKGEARCIEPFDFFERRTMALARMREREAELRDG